MFRTVFYAVILSLPFVFPVMAFSQGKPDDGHLTLRSAEEIQDKIRGGLIGQIFANLNGIQYEMRFIDEPGNVTDYTPALPDGAEADDDTDIEWVYVVAMQEHGLFVPYDTLSAIWQRKINRHIWCSHQYVRHLLSLGVSPEVTGAASVNPWAEFNIAGQFTCEMFGQMSPLMPQSASRLATHYLIIPVDAEPLQTTQFFASMISAAFEENDISTLLDIGLLAVDPESQVAGVIRQTRIWCAENPTDWRKTRRLIRDAYTRNGGNIRDRNGYELNTAATVAALVYGQGDYVQTATYAFNFGWDCDNTAATAGTILGVICGNQWFRNQGWVCKDVYKNTRRDDMPSDETITSFGDRLIEMAEKHIVASGGQILDSDDGKVYAIKAEQPKNVLSIKELKRIREETFALTRTRITQEFDSQENAAALAGIAYLALCLDCADDLEQKSPSKWSQAIDAINRQEVFLKYVFKDTDFSSADSLKQKLQASGVVYVSK